MPAGFSDHYGRYLLYKTQISRSLNPRLLFMYWRRSVKGVAVAKPSGHCIRWTRFAILYDLRDTYICQYVEQLKTQWFSRETLAKEGVVRGLYTGTVPSLAANVAENSILFAAYGLCQKAVAGATNTEVSKLSTFSNGVSGKPRWSESK